MGFRDDVGVRVATANGAQLVALLYEGLIENLTEIDEILKSQKEVSLLDERLENSREILSHLMATLGENNETTLATKSLYMYVNSLMTEGYNKKSREKFEEAKKVLIPVWEAWIEVGKKLEEENSTVDKPSVVAGMTYGKNNISEYVQGSVKDWDKG